MKEEEAVFISYDEAIKMNPLEVKAIELGDTFPEEVREMKNLQKVKIMGYGMTALPDWLAELSELQSFDFYNHCKEIISSKSFKLLGQLPKLEELEVTKGPIPADISLLKGLKRLRVSFWHLRGSKVEPEVLKKMAELPKLEELEVDTGDFPPEIGLLKGLKRLRLLEQSEPEVQKAIFSLPQLESLILMCSDINEMPAEAAGLKNLTYLNLSSCELTEIPKPILAMSGLRTLILESNDIMEIPEELSQLTALQTLNLKRNSLEDFPKAVLKLTGLQSLSLANNRSMGHVPEEVANLTELTSLHLEDTGLQSYPEGLSKLVKLKALSLSHNLLGEPEGALSGLQQLEELALENCRIENFPQELLNLKKLRVLNLEWNGLSKVPDEIGTLVSLEKLKLKGNALKGLPDTISQLINLKEIDLDENPITKKNRKKIEELLQINKEKAAHEQTAEATMKEEMIRVAQLVKHLNETADKEEKGSCRYAFTVYSDYAAEGYEILAEADTAFGALKKAAEVFIAYQRQSDAFIDEEPDISLPEEWKDYSHYEMAAFFEYYQDCFNFIDYNGKYEEDCYFEELLDAIPNSSFLFGWSAAPPRQSEAYALLRLSDEE